MANTWGRSGFQWEGVEEGKTRYGKHGKELELLWGKNWGEGVMPRKKADNAAALWSAELRGGGRGMENNCPWLILHIPVYIIG